MARFPTALFLRIAFVAVTKRIGSRILEITSICGTGHRGRKGDTATKAANTLNFSGPLFGSLFSVDHYGSGTVGAAYGLEGEVSNLSSGTLSNAYALWLQLQNTATGEITNGYGLRIGAPVNKGGGTLGNYYGIYVEKPSALTNNYSIYSAGGTNYFAGSVGIGVSTPSSPITVNGVIQTTSGGIKFPDGTTQSTAQVQGPAGPQGPTGATGPQGPVGATGTCRGHRSKRKDWANRTTRHPGTTRADRRDRSARSDGTNW